MPHILRKNNRYVYIQERIEHTPADKETYRSHKVRWTVDPRFATIFTPGEGYYLSEKDIHTIESCEWIDISSFARATLRSGTTVH